MDIVRYAEDYSFLVKVFGEEVISSRYDKLEEEINRILQENKLDNKVSLNIEALNEVMDCYFTDISRLKDFSGIKRVNICKIYSYMIYWFSRVRPLNIIDSETKQTFINERVILYIYIRHLLEHIRVSKDNLFAYGQILETCELLLYNLKYRIYSPQTIECSISALLNAVTMNTENTPLLF